MLSIYLRLHGNTLGWARSGVNEPSSRRTYSRRARRVAEAGCSTHQIMAITGHQTLKEVQRYTVATEQERLAQDAMKALAANSAATGIVKPIDPFDKPDRKPLNTTRK